MLILSLSIQAQDNNINQESTKSVSFTFSPPKNGVGIVFTYHNIILSAEAANIKYDKDQMNLAKYGIGYKVYKNLVNNYSFNIVGVYTDIYYQSKTIYSLRPDKIHKLSIELGFNLDVINNLTSIFYYDILNQDAKVGFGLKF